MRKIPLLIVLLVFSLGGTTAFADDALPGVSTVSGASSTLESTYEEVAAEPSSTAAASFDSSILLVLALGFGGLIWIRKQTQLL